MEKIIGINPVIEVLKSDKNIEKLEVYKKIKKETIKEILNLASRKTFEKGKIYSCCAGSGSGSEKFWGDYKKCGVLWS